MKFIKIKGVIYDYSEYKRNLEKLEKIINEELEQLIARYGFTRKRNNLFCNNKLNILLKLEFSRISKLKFV